MKYISSVSEPSGHTNGAVRAILIDDHPMLLRGLTLLFETVDGIDIVATSTDGSQALKLAEQHGADIVITDAAMPGVDGRGVVKQCCKHVPVLVLTTFDDASLVSTLLEEGAAGYILKDVPPEELFSAIRAAADGGLVLDPRIAQHARRHHGSRSDNRGGQGKTNDLAVLTRAELAVAELVARGANNREIADQLYLAEGTVKNHVSALLRKMNARDRTVLALRLADSLPSRRPD